MQLMLGMAHIFFLNTIGDWLDWSSNCWAAEFCFLMRKVSASILRTPLQWVDTTSSALQISRSEFKAVNKNKTRQEV